MPNKSLEKTISCLLGGDCEYMFCYVGINDRGSYFTIENDKDEFISTVYDAKNGKIEPGMSVGR